MRRSMSISEVAEEILHSVLASPQRKRHLLSRTIWGKFGFRVRTENRIQQVTDALRGRDLKATVENGPFGKELERERVLLTYTGLEVPTQIRIPPPPESWFRSMDKRNFESEREVEHYFVIPLLEQLGYEEADVFIAFPTVVKPGCGRKRLKVEVDVAVFNGLPHQKDNSLLVVETKSSRIELKDKHRHQACSYGFELHTPYCLLTNGDTIQVLRVSDEKPVFGATRADLRNKWSELFALLGKQTMIFKKQNQGGSLVTQ